MLQDILQLLGQRRHIPALRSLELDRQAVPQGPQCGPDVIGRNALLKRGLPNDHDVSLNDKTTRRLGRVVWGRFGAHPGRRGDHCSELGDRLDQSVEPLAHVLTQRPELSEKITVHAPSA